MKEQTHRAVNAILTAGCYCVPMIATPEFAKRSSAAFTLLELSVVLVIIGLIVGGVLVGNDLIRMSKTYKFIAEVSTIQSQLNLFKLRYNALPGDMANASNFWSSCSGRSCNGNGDGAIDNAETSFVWEILYKSGIEKNEYISCLFCLSGTPGPDVANKNYKQSQADNFVYHKIGGNGWGQNVIHMGGAWLNGSQNGDINIPIMYPVISMGIDAKLDDGKGNTGKIKSWYNPMHLSSSYCQSNGVYLVDYNARGCSTDWELMQ